MSILDRLNHIKMPNPKDQSGLFNAILKANEQSAAGLNAIGQSIADYSDSRQEAAGDALTAALMQAGDNEAARKAAMNQALSGAFRPTTDVLVKASQLNDSALDRALKQTELDISKSRLAWESNPDRLEALMAEIEANKLASEASKLASEASKSQSEFNTKELDWKKNLFNSIGSGANLGDGDYNNNAVYGSEYKPILQAQDDLVHLKDIKENDAFQFPGGANKVEVYDHFTKLRNYLQSKNLGVDAVERIMRSYAGQHQQEQYATRADAIKADSNSEFRQNAYSLIPEDFSSYTKSQYTASLGEAEGTAQYNKNRATLYKNALHNANNANFIHSDPKNKIAPKFTRFREQYSKYAAFMESIAGLPAEEKKAFEEQYISEQKALGNFDKDSISTLKNARAEDTKLVTNRIRDRLHSEEEIPSTEIAGMLPTLVQHGGMADLDTAFRAFEGPITTRIANNIKAKLRKEKPHLKDEALVDEIIRSLSTQQTIRQEVANLGLNQEQSTTALNLVNTHLGIAARQKSLDAQYTLAKEDLDKSNKEILKSKKTHTAENFRNLLVIPGTSDQATGAIGQTNDVYNMLVGHMPELSDNQDVFYKALRNFNPGVDKDTILGIKGLGPDNAYDLELGTIKSAPGDTKDYSMEGTVNAGANQALLDRLTAKSELFENDGSLTDSGRSLAKQLLGKEPSDLDIKFRTDEETEQVAFLRVIVRYMLDERENKMSAKRSAVRSLLDSKTPR